jgi:glutamate racemase
LLVPLIENNDYQNAGAHYFIKKYLTALREQSANIDTILLACTHYPLLKDKIEAVLPQQIKVLSQGEIVADSLALYLQRHPEMECRLSKGGTTTFYTTDDTANFNEKGTIFFGKNIASLHTRVPDEELLHNF